MEKDKFEEMHNEREVNRKAMEMMLSMMEAIMPDDMQPIIHLPKLVSQIDHMTTAILRMVSDAETFEDTSKLATEANVLLSRIDESLEAFIEQHTEGGMSE